MSTKEKAINCMRNNSNLAVAAVAEDVDTLRARVEALEAQGQRRRARG